jgi:ubiquinone/menaquinone biosynthesis C-methylase UbiE
MYRDEVEKLVFSAYQAIDSPHGSALWLYTEQQLESLPDGAKKWALGVGNPVPEADLESGETVLDLGCGSGIDVLLAARQVGPTGKAIGLDGLPEMVERGRAFAAETGAENVEFVHGMIDDIPLPDDSVDVIISNGSINLAARKSRVMAESARVLKPGGRFVAADLTIVEEDIPPEVLTHPSAWAG